MATPLSSANHSDVILAGGETFTIHPGEILVAEDVTGSSRKWRLVNDEPWKRAYVVFKQGADTHFLPDPA